MNTTFLIVKHEQEQEMPKAIHLPMKDDYEEIKVPNFLGYEITIKRLMEDNNGESTSIEE